MSSCNVYFYATGLNELLCAALLGFVKAKVPDFSILVNGLANVFKNNCQEACPCNTWYLISIIFLS